MKILMVSMFAPHFFNWTEQLRDSEHEIYWIDIFDSNTKVKKIDFVTQIIGWRNKIDYPGRYWVKGNIPKLNHFINRFNQHELAEIFEKKLLEIKPDLVQSFVMYSACVPIYHVMQKFPDIKWVYSSWGNDLFFYQNEQRKLKDMKNVLPRINYMFSDCFRDFEIAKSHGFQGTFLGVFPGGGGYDFDLYDPDIVPFSQRNVLLIKGYQHKFGRCNKVLEAICHLKQELVDFEIVVFAANKVVIDYCREKGLDSWENFKLYGKIPHSEVLKLMGASKIYIGNSISDGMPNTLLEAIIMGAFPIQSNPGGATAEIIVHGENGLLIEDPENAAMIRNLIKIALSDNDRLKKSVEHNIEHIKPTLERGRVKKEVIEKYCWVESQI